MSRYILSYKGRESPPASDLEGIRSLPGLNVVDASCSQLILIEATDSAVQKLMEMPSWSVVPEKFVPLPDTRKSIRRPH